MLAEGVGPILSQPFPVKTVTRGAARPESFEIETLRTWGVEELPAVTENESDVGLTTSDGDAAAVVTVRVTG
ncbi:MAG: hypothetical protein ABSB35_34050, partial [Bryobacteraceae bacterium]